MKGFLYIEEASEKRKKREKELNVTKNSGYLYRSELHIYKNIPSSDLTEEHFSLQIIPLNHYNTKPIHCDFYQIH